jgi:hypothetical protein
MVGELRGLGFSLFGMTAMSVSLITGLALVRSISPPPNEEIRRAAFVGVGIGRAHGSGVATRQNGSATKQVFSHTQWRSPT